MLTKCPECGNGLIHSTNGMACCGSFNIMQCSSQRRWLPEDNFRSRFVKIENEGEFGAICLCAVRYAIGRMTYMPSLVVGFIKDNWHNLDDNTKIIIQRDVGHAIKDDLAGFNSLGHECDRVMWTKFAKWIEEQYGSQGEQQVPSSDSEA